MRNMMFRVAASTIAVGAMIVFSNPALGGGAKPEVEAVKSAANAEKAMAKKKAADAVVHAERAVALMPREAGYRMLLGQAYLSAGRFASAEAAFADTLALSPAELRAAVSMTLTQIALGKRDAALETLGKHSGSIGVADQGLAIALAGDPRGGVSMLEDAARSPEANARIRQNLALSYALAGRWREAKMMASLDMSPADLPRRLGEWAQFVQSGNPTQQVASLLGVTPSNDPGQPVALALAPQAAPVAFAEVAPPPPPVAIPETTIETAAVETTPAVDISAYDGVQFAARGEVAQPLPAIVEQRLPDSPRVKPTVWPAKPVAAPRMLRKASIARLVPANLVRDGGYVVQLGAFSAPARVEAAWNGAVGKFAGLSDFTPSSTTFVPKPGAAMLYRLSVGGFRTRGDAVATCGQIKARGGACFVRAAAGDSVPQWALRAKKREQLASR